MTKKKTLIITLILSLFLIISPTSVKALDNTYNDNNLMMSSSYRNEDLIMRLDDGDGSNEGLDCSGLLTDDGIELVQEILSYIRVLAPLFVIIYSAIDFTRAVLGRYDNKEDSLETAKIKVGKRLLACIILIFIPTILKILLTTYQGDIEIDSSCLESIH